MKRLNLGLFIILLLAFQGGCSNPPYQDIVNMNEPSGSTLICFGDSLTSGMGAKEINYPSLIAQKISMPVINAGRSGDTTYSALNRIKADVLSKDPKVVIVELGANDFLLWRDAGRPGYTLEDTFKNIETIIDKIQEGGAAVVLAAIPFDYEYKKNYERIAREKGALLIPNIMEGVLGHSDLMSLDRVHPNDEGYKVMAQTVLKYVEPLLKVKK